MANDIQAMKSRLILSFSAVMIIAVACNPAQPSDVAPTDTSLPPTATATRTATATGTRTVTPTPSRTNTPAPTFFPTLNSYALENVPDTKIPVAVTIYDDTFHADAILTGTFGGIRDGGSAFSKLVYFFPHTSSLLLWRDSTTRCTSPYNAYPSSVERVSLFDVTALEFTAERRTCNGTVIVLIWPDGRQTTRAIVSREIASGSTWEYGDVSTGDDLVIYVAYGPVAIPLPMVKKIGLLKLY
jgi:hypothetical protein